MLFAYHIRKHTSHSNVKEKYNIFTHQLVQTSDRTVFCMCVMCDVWCILSIYFLPFFSSKIHCANYSENIVLPFISNPVAGHRNQNAMREVIMLKKGIRNMYAVGRIEILSMQTYWIVFVSSGSFLRNSLFYFRLFFHI